MLRHASVTRAAAHVGLTQSALSSALGRLRKQFGDQLFINTRSGMLPTPRALELAPPLTEALALIRNAMSASGTFDARTSRRSLRLCMTDVGEMVLLPALMRHLGTEGPALRLETAQLPSAELAARLESNDIDLAIGYLPQLPEKMRRACLFQEHYVCMTRRGHPAGLDAPITEAQFLASRHILIASMGSGHQTLERTLARHGVQDNVALRVPHFVVVSMIVAGTDLVVSLPSRAAAASTKLVEVKVHPLPIPIPSFDVMMYWHERVDNDPANLWLRRVVQALFGEQAGAPPTTA